MKDLYAIYPDIEDFIASTAVARINGHIGGYGIRETLDNELNSLGLSEAGQKRLIEIADIGLVPGHAVQ